MKKGLGILTAGVGAILIEGSKKNDTKSFDPKTEALYRKFRTRLGDELIRSVEKARIRGRNLPIDDIFEVLKKGEF